MGGRMLSLDTARRTSANVRPSHGSRLVSISHMTRPRLRRGGVRRARRGGGPEHVDELAAGVVAELLGGHVAGGAREV
jgi:hypothetical protein